MIQDLEIGFRAARSVPDVSDTLGPQKTKFMKFFFSAEKKNSCFLKNSKSSDFWHSSASARKAKEGISSFWTDFGHSCDFRYVALFPRKSSARTAGSGPPPIQLTTRTFYLCILMNICQSKTRFATSQAPWEALARATSCDFGQKATTGRPKVQHSGNR